MLVVVVRYYGGVNLGTSGLIVAYREAAQLAIADAKKETRQVEEIVSYDFPYTMMNSVMKVVKDLNPQIIAQGYDTNCTMTLRIRRGMMQQLRERLSKVETLNFIEE